MPAPGQKSPDKMIRTVGVLSTVGFAFVLAVVLGAAFGFLLDHWFGTHYIFFLIFFFFGLVAGILNVFRMAAVFTEEQKSEDEPPHP